MSRFVARALTLLLVFVDALVLSCVYTYYTDEANPSRYQIMQVAMLLLLFIALPIIVGQGLALSRTTMERMSRKEHRRHKALAVFQLYFLLLIMLLPVIF